MIPHNKLVLHPDDHEAVARVMASGHIGQGPEVEAFEHELAARFRPGGAAVCVSSGTAALMLALRSAFSKDYSYGDGPEVLLPTYACSSLYHAARAARCGTDLVDVDADTWSADATVFVHTFGVPWYGMGAVEDFTHAPGATVSGRPCGSLGALSVISFGATKPLGIGAGGAILGPVDRIAEIRDSRDYDTSRREDAFNWGMSDLHAALGRSRLRRLDEDNRRRAAIANRYCHALPMGLNHQAPKEHHPDSRVWYRFVIAHYDPAVMIHAKSLLKGCDVETIVPIRADELLHRRLGYHADLYGAFPIAEQLAQTTLSLPIWPGMTRNDVDCVCRALEKLEGVC